MNEHSAPLLCCIVAHGVWQWGCAGCAAGAACKHTASRRGEISVTCEHD